MSSLPTNQIAVWSENALDSDGYKLAKRLGCIHHIGEDPPTNEDLRWLFYFDNFYLYLHSLEHPDYKPIYIDYFAKDFAKRWRSLGRNDLLMKAIGTKKGVRTVLDATCGMGYDAFLMATQSELDVTTCERNPLIAELVNNALLRVKESARFEDFPLYIHYGDTKDFLNEYDFSFDAIYLDPMFSKSANETAKPKKEMFLFRELLGDDLDAGELFATAYERANKRVIVKRSDKSRPLVEVPAPDISFSGNTIRYDVYLKK
ncbi:MAG: class I SAM-dependent methyltransferase [Oligoflexia bacterium]|nr:class I SAM-dependent methyltransferase [Oligoflexia bacterium]